jgi:GT2 family glycosyltransferase
MPEVSVVIPSHGGADLIAKVIAPLLADPATLEVIVVADDDLKVAAAAHAIGDPCVRVVTAAACNPNIARRIGVEQARAETVLMLDDDVLPAPGLVSGHARRHPVPGLAVLGYMPIPPQNLRGPLRFPARLYSNVYEGRAWWWSDRPDLIMTGFWGGNVSMTRADILRVGLDNPAFPGRYFEDLEFGRRCQAQGIRGVFDRSLAASHLYERSISQWFAEARRQGAALSILEPGVEPGAGHRPAFMRTPLLAATIVSAALHLRRLEARLARAARRIEINRGAQEVAAGTAVAHRLLAAEPTAGPVARAAPVEPASAAHDDERQVRRP